MKAHLIAILAVIIVVVVAFFIFAPGEIAERHGDELTNATSDSPSVCSGCITAADNGETFEELITSRITLELSEARYPQNGLSIIPPTMLGETIGSTTEAGNWMRTFEVLAPGAVTIRVPAKDPSIVPFKIVIHVPPPASR